MPGNIELSRSNECLPSYHSQVPIKSGIDPFTVTRENGFMPLHLPVTALPAVWQPLLDLVEAMPIAKLDGRPGLLASFELGPAIDLHHSLPDLTKEVSELRTADGRPDLSLVTAVFREYSFLSSAYLLEPCWERQSKGLDGYGLGRAVLPIEIAGPLVKTAELLDVPPFMAYAAAYSLYNFRLKDNNAGMTNYSNLQLIRAFERGLDASSSEAGFILTHVDMVKHTPRLVQGAMSLLSSNMGLRDMTAAYDMMLDSMVDVHASMERMWAHSKPAEYLNYRTFIFGITSQSMFPDGVIYAGQFEDEPQYFRGESGANDSIIPLLDGLLEIPFPSNPLTDILVEFRNYRPAPHRAFLAHVREKAQSLGVREMSLKNLSTRILYLRLIDSVMRFRWRHWTFAREYILKRTKHPTATGGSPMVKWLPNQLFAVMELMQSVWDGMSQDEQQGSGVAVKTMVEEMQKKREALYEEVDKWCRGREE